MKILLPVDGSECSLSTLQWASETFDKVKTEYYILYVIHSLPELPIEEHERLHATEVLKLSRQTLEENGCKVLKADYMSGDVPGQIDHYAEEMMIDQILIGSHGRSGLVKLVMGSVSSAVLEHAQKPVLVYRNVVKNPSTIPIIPSNTLL
jgi:nucleotide-binding universal stress UspA family protein